MVSLLLCHKIMAIHFFVRPQALRLWLVIEAVSEAVEILSFGDLKNSMFGCLNNSVFCVRWTSIFHVQ